MIILPEPRIKNKCVIDHKTFKIFVIEHIINLTTCQSKLWRSVRSHYFLPNRFTFAYLLLRERNFDPRRKYAVRLYDDINFSMQTHAV